MHFEVLHEEAMSIAEDVRQCMIASGHMTQARTTSAAGFRSAAESLGSCEVVSISSFQTLFYG